MDFLQNKGSRLEHLLPLIEEQLRSGGTVSFVTNGTSMLPMLRDGQDKIVLSPLNGRLKKYDLPLYRRKNGQFVLHRVVKVEETYSCIGDNQFDVESGIHSDQIIGVVSSFTRNGKTYSVNNIGYQLYCRLWHYSRFLRRIYRSIKWRLLK